MAFSLYCLINENSNRFSIEFFKKELKKYFSKMEGLSLSYEEDPFDSSNIHLLLSWEGWWIRFFYETGQHVIDDSVEVAKHAKKNLSSEISSIDKRIIVRFADDESKIYTNHIILMIDYLQDIPNIIIFNHRTKKFIVS